MRKNMNKKITPDFCQSLDSLLVEAGRQPLLTIEQEVELVNRIKQGDEEALQKMYDCNRRFVISVAMRYQNKGLTVEELIHEGNIGLEEACRRYAPTENVKFIAYAVWFIRQSIQNAINKLIEQ